MVAQTDQQDRAFANLQRFVEPREVIRVERHHDHAVERAVAVEHLAAELDRPLVGHAAQNRFADEQLVLRGAEMHLDMLAIRQVHAADQRQVAGRHDAVAIGHRDLQGQTIQDIVGRYQLRQIERFGVMGAGVAQYFQELVGAVDHPFHVFAEAAGEIGGVVHARPLALLALLDQMGTDADPQQHQRQDDQEQWREPSLRLVPAAPRQACDVRKRHTATLSYRLSA